ncbi:MAG: ABC transporter ATP-binding protein [Dethiobacteraceae bacterium]|jgi:ABC-2 type transport system ATP-binding protein|nr:ABC transporter ATP-binding protein [Bacillota bacterium]
MILEVKQLEKSFGARRAVAGINLLLNEGEVLGLLGPNGAGKTTTLAMIGGLLQPEAGSITIGGWDLQRHPLQAKALLGIVPQEPALYPQLSAAANLRFWGTMQGLQRSELNKAVAEALAVVGLTERARERVVNYSGGMKRRLNIAAGILHRPKLLIMDEPTVGVDPQSRNHIHETVKRLQCAGTAIIYTSHYVEEVEELCGRVLIMDAGKVVAAGTVAELLRAAGHAQELVIKVNRPHQAVLSRLTAIPGVREAVMVGQAFKLLTLKAEQVLPLAYEYLLSQGLQVSAIEIHKPNLESLFLKLTGKSLRDQ